jgi:hypothetical protein
MAVVINEMEVAPQPAPDGAPGAQPAQGADSASKDKLKQVVKTLHKRHQRTARLEAY